MTLDDIKTMPERAQPMALTWFMAEQAARLADAAERQAHAMEHMAGLVEPMPQPPEQDEMPYMADGCPLFRCPNPELCAGSRRGCIQLPPG